jgi:hypothetical protein
MCAVCCVEYIDCRAGVLHIQQKVACISFIEREREKKEYRKMRI